MFNGVSSSSSDQFHQFMASSRSASSLIPINNNNNNIHIPSCFSLDHHENPSFSAAFDNTYTSSSSLNTHEQALHHQESSPVRPNNNNTSKDIDIDVDVADDDDDDDVKHVVGSIDPWSNEEVLSLLRLRSTIDIWFPDFTWQHISRKLGELGFKRSAEQCKQRFGQESKQHLDMSSTTTSTAVNYNKLNNYSDILMSELDEFYPPDNQQQAPPLSSSAPKHMNQLDHHGQDQKLYKNYMELENEENLAAAAPPQESEQVLVAKRRPTQSIKSKKKKKKRRDKFEVFKGFCQAVVNKIMAQQEELHNKMIEDIMKRDEEKIAIDEARKKEEIDRLQKEMEIRAKEQAIAHERQATLIDFLKRFTSQDDHRDHDHLLLKVNSNDALNNKLETPASSSSKNIAAEQNIPKHITKSSIASADLTITSLSTSCLVNNANTSISAPTNESTTHLELWTTKNECDERGGEDHMGKRWPRDEVLALINLRCKMNNNNNSTYYMSNNNNGDHHPAKGPLWERISQGMMELGYKRNSKRCKEKWENINKYFRKTKDSNKKRSVNSRTCPYFQQLSSLYNSQGTLQLVNVAPTNVPDNP